MGTFDNPLDFANLQGIPGLTPAVVSTAETIRLWMRDHPELNRLVEGYETSDRQLLFAVMDAVASMNGTPPPTQLSLEEWLRLNQFQLIRYFTVIHLLEGIGLLQTRNHISYSSGGKSVGVNDKTPLIMGWLKYFRSVADQKLAQVKVSMNIMSILGPEHSGQRSEYWVIHSTFANW